MDRAAQWVEERCAAGCRVIIVDPITLADPGAPKSWEADRQFMARVKVAIEGAGSSLVLVTHPRKAFGSQKRTAAPSLDDLAGGAAYQRAAASVLWLASHSNTTPEQVETEHGEHLQAMLHRVVRVLKARNAVGVGAAIGFSNRRLTFHEEGRLIPAAAIVNRPVRLQGKPAHAHHNHEPRDSEDKFAGMDGQP